MWRFSTNHPRKLHVAFLHEPSREEPYIAKVGVVQKDTLLNKAPTVVTLNLGQSEPMNRSCYVDFMNELRYVPMWLIENSHKKTKASKNASPSTSSPSTQDSINLGDNEVGDIFVGLERPMERKASKEGVRNEKGKRIVDMSAASTLKFEEYVEDIKGRNKKRQEEKDRLQA
ncbi:hypothetical protein Dsin_030393 [Dipteronia sinensis]|uniref:Uncharacterized protein n=1 Tax=Dipteronia sinensis TaxID=43782 RepID=A0AAE0DR95_9ROSI|nr:hypothetical protein Dsin_030393 [Dipteronia sinensis]